MNGTNSEWPPADLCQRSDYVRDLCKEIALRESAECCVCGETFKPHRHQIRPRRMGLPLPCSNRACKSTATLRRRRARYAEQKAASA